MMVVRMMKMERIIMKTDKNQNEIEKYRKKKTKKQIHNEKMLKELQKVKL